MDRFISLLSLFFMAVVSHAALPPQLVYWHSVLPNSKMPSSIADLIPHEGGTTVNVGNGGVHVGIDGQRNYFADGQRNYFAAATRNYFADGQRATRNYFADGQRNYFADGQRNYFADGQRATRNYFADGQRNYFADGQRNYFAAATPQMLDNPSVSLFFLEKDIRPGTALTLLFTKTTPGSAFLPRSEADAIPFSSAKLPDILARFSIKPGSPEADVMRTTLQECEEPAMRGERQHCATSLESMVEFATSILGTPRVAAASTEVSKPGTLKQSYTIKGAKAMAGEPLVACHAVPYAYAVFFCHATGAAQAYTVEMAGADGAEVKAVAVCHTDTRAWNPDHVALKVLGVKPGTVPVCHFLSEENVLWSRTT